MTLTVKLESGAEVVYADAGLACLVVWYEDPAIVKGAANGAANTNFASVHIFDTQGKRRRFAVNNPAYLPNGYEELSSAETPKDVYDAADALTGSNEVLPTDPATVLDADYPFRVLVFTAATQGIKVQSSVANANIYGRRTIHYLDLSPRTRFMFMADFAKVNYDNDYIFELTVDEFAAVDTLLEGLC